jgi:hypothetical protein
MVLRLKLRQPPKHKVHCGSCAFFFYTEKLGPLCVATAKFRDGPIRKKIDLIGVKSAEERNIHNDCQLYESVSLSAWQMKRWLLRRLTDGEKAGYKHIETYDPKEETKRANTLRRSTEEKAAAEETYNEEDIISYVDEEADIEFDDEEIEDDGIYDGIDLDESDYIEVDDEGQGLETAFEETEEYSEVEKTLEDDYSEESEG